MHNNINKQLKKGWIYSHRHILKCQNAARPVLT